MKKVHSYFCISKKGDLCIGSGTDINDESIKNSIFLKAWSRSGDELISKDSGHPVPQALYKAYRSQNEVAFQRLQLLLLKDKNLKLEIINQYYSRNLTVV